MHFDECKSTLQLHQELLPFPPILLNVKLIPSTTKQEQEIPPDISQRPLPSKSSTSSCGSSSKYIHTVRYNGTTDLLGIVAFRAIDGCLCTIIIVVESSEFCPAVVGRGSRVHSTRSEGQREM